jgi:nucleotide-binding universal stress UspA family protein
MFNKLLVAIDTSEIGHQVFNEALTLAKLSNASLMLFHVLSNEEEGSPMLPIFAIESYPLAIDTYREQFLKYEQMGLEILRSCRDEAIAAGVRAECTQSQGNPGRAICDLARTWGADYIVMGRQGHSALSEFVLGSVSNYVLDHASCSVLIVQHLLKTSSPKI